MALLCSMCTFYVGDCLCPGEGWLSWGVGRSEDAPPFRTPSVRDSWTLM